MLHEVATRMRAMTDSCNFAGRVIASIEATQLALVVKEPLGVWGCIVLTDNDAGPFGGFKQSGFGRELGQESGGLPGDEARAHRDEDAPKEWWYPYAPADAAPPSGAGA
jgi:hypothetical protein